MPALFFWLSSIKYIIVYGIVAILFLAGIFLFMRDIIRDFIKNVRRNIK